MDVLSQKYNEKDGRNKKEKRGGGTQNKKIEWAEKRVKNFKFM